MTVSLVVIMFELTGSLEFIVPTMAAVMFAKWVGDAIYKTGIYDAHIELNGYPFLDNKGEYPYSTVAAQVMRPSNEMRVIEQNGMSVGELETVLRESNCNGFPVVNDVNQMLVVGFCTRMDLGQVLKNARKTMPYITTNSPVYFTSTTTNCDTNNINRNINSQQQQPETFDNIIIVDEQRRRRRKENERVEEENSEISEQLPGSPAPLYINHIMDVAPMTVADQTPMETVIDMFRKLGLRGTLVTNNGSLLFSTFYTNRQISSSKQILQTTLSLQTTTKHQGGMLFCFDDGSGTKKASTTLRSATTILPMFFASTLFVFVLVGQKPKKTKSTPAAIKTTERTTTTTEKPKYRSDEFWLAVFFGGLFAFLLLSCFCCIMTTSCCEKKTHFCTKTCLMLHAINLTVFTLIGLGVFFIYTMEEIDQVIEEYIEATKDFEDINPEVIKHAKKAQNLGPRQMPLPPYCSVGISTISDRPKVDRKEDTTTANSLMGATETSKIEAAEHSKMGGKSEEAKAKDGHVTLADYSKAVEAGDDELLIKYTNHSESCDVKFNGDGNM
uniref:Chloride channel protein n=1 Tax=Meloidogyne floridensis TaxID=298350 RepID=A0A915PCK5_9BILA